ncbi:hypothetical protein [Methylobacterium sp. J-068]|uniref:hypothetical protein n=1 Tax=Methylobacterium sp. J-068 TaxID=2836649 RepID=UPI001FB8CE43|nr:hypothetical protein [Methylobacterium sp. J-068]MCJ2036887.1 hypothetical protein [Methylobacterium sp. J-068]
MARHRGSGVAVSIAFGVRTVAIALASFVVLDPLAAGACDLRLVFASWPDVQPLGQDIKFRSPGGSTLTISRLAIEQAVGGRDCIAKVRVEADSDLPASRLSTAREIHRLADDQNFAREYALDKVKKVCDPVRVEVDDNIGSSDKRQFMPHYFFARSDGSFESISFTVCGP